MVAIPSMNDTHLEETIIINKLETAVINSDIEAIKELLKALIAHTKIHFADEEKLMKDASFPEYQVHKSEHDRHLSELDSLVIYFDKHQEPKAIRAYIDGSLTPWMIHHVKGMDTMLAQSVQQ